MPKQLVYNDLFDQGFSGQQLSAPADGVFTMVNNEASNPFAFGFAVIFEGSTEDKGALLPSSETDLVAGLVVHSHAYGDTQLIASPSAQAEDGIAPGQLVNVMREGRMLVRVGTAVTPGDRLWVRAVSDGGGVEFLGGLEDADDSTDTIDCTNQGVFLTTAAIDGLAVIEVDFTNKPGI